jgi:hypothetical protein
LYCCYELRAFLPEIPYRQYQEAPRMSRAARISVYFALFVLTASSAFAQYLTPNSIQVSRVNYDGVDSNLGNGDTYTSPYSFPEIFNDQAGCNTENNICNIAGIQGSIYIDQYGSVPASSTVGTSLSLPSTGAYVSTFPTPEPGTYITTSFSSKSEGALMLSPNSMFLTYMGYQGPDTMVDVSNGYSLEPEDELSPNTYTDSQGTPYPFYDREVALINSSGLVSLTPIDNADSGDNPRAAITADGNELYTAGNSDSTEKPVVVGGVTYNEPGLTIGVRCAIPENSQSYQLGTYTATDRPDESTKQHVKDNNWRGIGIYTDADGNQQLYVSKGSGGNGDDGLFQVGAPLPSCTLGGTDTSNTISELPGLAFPVTNQSTGAATPILPFGFWFANPTTLYLADEGNPPSYTGGSKPSFSNSTNGTYVPSNDAYAGLEKWSLVGGAWQLDYTIQAGLNFNQPQTFSGYTDINGNPIQSYTYGLRNMTGYNNGDGTVTIYAITSQFSAVSGGESDPTSLVGITDSLAATTLPANEQFVTLQTSANQEVFRGVAYVPPSAGFTRGTQTITFPNPGTQTYGAAPITLTATATSGWPIAYSVISGPATISGNVLTITGAGSVTVEADQSGNTDYSAATPNQQTFTVNQASQTISFTFVPATATYGTSFTVSATASSGFAVVFSSSGGCTNSGATYTMTSGTTACSVIANQPGNNNYLPAAPDTKNVTAYQATQSITFTVPPPASAAYESSFTIAASASSGLPVTYSSAGICSNSGATYTMNAPSGTCTIFVNAGGNGDYLPAPQLEASNTATKATPVITWSTPTAISYGTALSTAQLDATANVAGTIRYTPAAGKILTAGTQTLSASFTPTSKTDYTTAMATTSLQVLQESTSTTVTSSDQAVTLDKTGVATATVDYNVVGYKPTGAVTLTTSTGESCTGAVSSSTGNGDCKLYFVSPGTRTVTASYSGDDNHAGSNSDSQSPAVTVTVNP